MKNNLITFILAFLGFYAKAQTCSRFKIKELTLPIELNGKIEEAYKKT